MAIFNLNYPSADNGTSELSIGSGQILFLVGANGTGKSTLMQKFASQNQGKIRRITAHRQVWFNSNTLDLTPQGRENSEHSIRSSDTHEQSRYKDDHASQRSQITIYDLIDSENIEARKIADAIRDKRIEDGVKLASELSPISKLNQILKLSNLNFELHVDKGSKLVAVKEQHAPYSIAELSDGERNALLIIANVLTAPPETLILLDEPERHLHRSIASPLISTLLTFRSDCAFVVSTHDVTLPVDQEQCASLLLRTYSHAPQYWITEYIDSIENIDDQMAIAILGSRRNIVFIEGVGSSLDLQIYQLLFPSVSIRPVGSCVEVEKIVKGIRAIATEHRVNALGVVDKDNRSESECLKLQSEGIIPLDFYSVESLYYHPNTYTAVFQRASKAFGIPKAQLKKIPGEIIKAVTPHIDRLAARVVEQSIKDEITGSLPDWRKVMAGPVEMNFSTENQYNEEKALLQSFIDAKDVAAIISRYPVRETQVLETIASHIGFRSILAYEQAVRYMVAESEMDKTKMLSLIQPLVNALALT